MSSAAAESGEGPQRRNYAVVTLAYWADTFADGAIRTLVLFYFYQLGYSALQVASLFLLYEVFGMVTNLCGGFVAARFGLKSTLFLGLGTQLAALSMLGLRPAAELTVAYVMASQALSGIAKDLTKMSSKSAVKLVAGESRGRLFKWVAALTGSKNALKGAGFFFGSLMLSVSGFQTSVWILAGLVAVAAALAALLMRGGLGAANRAVKFRHLFSSNQAVNLLSLARLFLFGARDVWFVVAVPVFFSSVLGWPFWQSGAFMALWVIGYGAVQAFSPAFIRRRGEVCSGQPDGQSAMWLAFALAAVPSGIVVALWSGVAAPWVVTVGLIVFGVVLALNSAVHSYLILAYANHEKVAMDVGIYYMANACGRLLGTLFSGLVYQMGVDSGPNGGLTACLLASFVFVLISGVLAHRLPGARTAQGRP